MFGVTLIFIKHSPDVHWTSLLFSMIFDRIAGRLTTLFLTLLCRRMGIPRCWLLLLDLGPPSTLYDSTYNMLNKLFNGMLTLKPFTANTGSTSNVVPWYHTNLYRPLIKPIPNLYQTLIKPYQTHIKPISNLFRTLIKPISNPHRSHIKPLSNLYQLYQTLIKPLSYFNPYQALIKPMSNLYQTLIVVPCCLSFLWLPKVNLTKPRKLLNPVLSNEI